MNRALVVLGLLFAALLSPPVHGLLFALEPHHPSDRAGLWSLSAALGLFAVLVLRRTARQWILKLTLLGLTLLSVELAARTFLTWFTTGPREKLARLGRATYPDLHAYRPHPFLQFTGRPGHVLQGNEALSTDTPFDEHGFLGPEAPMPKPAGTCRIVCLGGSTTASGYPQRLAVWLAQNAPTAGPAVNWECINLAHGFYDSTHSVVNFALNARDCEPDYVIVHHGWNDGRAKFNVSQYRGDHSHVLRAFEPPQFPDRLLIRASVIYRFLRSRLSGDGWGYLDAALLQPVEDHRDRDLTPALRTFERNLRTIADLALLADITPVFATMPHSTADDVPFVQGRPDLPPLAEVMRKLATSYGDRALLVDLAEQLTGQNELYRDLAHMTPTGLDEKAALLGRAILAHRAGRPR